jgi:hypothetical protein
VRVIGAVVPYDPDMDVPSPSSSVYAGATAMVGRVAKVKALQPITSTRAPSRAVIVEYSEKGILLRSSRFMSVGTIVQLHLAGEFSLWKVFCCIPYGNNFHLGLELAKALPLETRPGRPDAAQRV